MNSKKQGIIDFANGSTAHAGQASLFLEFGQVPRSGGFRLSDYWVWCGSPIRDDDGTYHLFASRWPKAVSFNPHWLTHSEIVRATSKTPEGPYQLADVILPARGEEHWDGRMTHNPAIIRWRDKYLLFYTGTTYEGPTPSAKDQITAKDIGSPDFQAPLDERVIQAHRNQRIGMAVADKIEGPWERPSEPLIEPRPGKWDSLITTNPSPCIGPNDEILLIYKSVQKRGGFMHLGLAQAATPTAPFTRVQDQPLFQFDASGQDVEDPFFWYDGKQFCLLAKDMEGELSGTARAGVMLTSSNGVDWDPSSVTPAYNRTLTWQDGEKSEQAFLERPSLLIENGHPTHFFAATATGGDSVDQISDAWNIAIPLENISKQ